jgi:hypothetical protein
MRRACIICGGPTGSREHIFPAALGGRRTNKGIYCGDHNNAYSGLAGIISEQLALFNAQLGVIGDHGNEATSVTMTDVGSGREVELSGSQIRFKAPQIISQEVANGETFVQMSFSSQKDADQWVREQKAQGVDVRLIGRGKKTRYQVGTAHKQLKLGGTEEGMRAIGYIAQTFLAHSFPDVARLPELQAIKDYTLHTVGSGFVWWDFEPPGDLPPNKFAFGHRVIVGLNHDDGTAYARISLFSSLHFAILLGKAPIEASRAVITDIDPLAKSPPNDIYSWAEDTAAGAVSKPDTLAASLASAISSGKAQAQLGDLMRRITDFERATAAKGILGRLAGAAALPESDRDKLFGEIVSFEGQRVLRLMQGVAEDCRRRTGDPAQAAIAAILEKSAELDPASANGLTAEATRSLGVACDALAKQMSEDFKAGILDQDRMEMLIGGGIGMHAVGTALLHNFATRFPDA